MPPQQTPARPALFTCGPPPMAASTRPKNERCGVRPDASCAYKWQTSKPMCLQAAPGVAPGAGALHSESRSSSSQHRRCWRRQHCRRRSAAASHLHLNLLLYCRHAALLLRYRLQGVPQLRFHRHNLRPAPREETQGETACHMCRLNRRCRALLANPSPIHALPPPPHWIIHPM